MKPVVTSHLVPGLRPGARSLLAARARRLVALALISACLGPARAAAQSEDNLDLLEQRAFQAAADRVAPSVVRIQTVGGLEQGGRARLGTGPTSGLVVDREGYIVSSAFGFSGRPVSILVELPDGARKPARLVATDHSRMLVLLKVDADEPLPLAEIVPEDEIRVGQWAIAVGRTFEGGRPNLSVGIVSALDRVWGKAIQTDAAVSPNNYGGPLVDVRGRVLGVLVPLSPQTATELAGVEWYDSGIGFAVPAGHVQTILPRLKEGRDLHPGVIGIGFAPGNLSTAEAVIAACHPNSPAYQAGLQAGDRIVEIAGRKVLRASQVKEQLSRHYAGETIRMVVLRDAERVDCELSLVAKLEPYEHPFLGILPMRTAAGSGADSGAESGAESGAQPLGVTARYVYPDGPAAGAGMERGDVLVALAGEPIQDADQLRRRISQRQPGDEVEIQVRRGQEMLRLKVGLGRLPEDVPPDPLPPARDLTEGAAEDGFGPNVSDRPQTGTIQLKIPEFENDAWAYVPDGYDPAVPHGLVVWLDEPARFDWNALIGRWRPHCDRHDLILLAPKSARPDRWQMGEITVVRRLVDQIQSTYRVDATRIVVDGRESGGRLGYVLAFQERELIRAVATVGSPLAGRPPENDPLYRLAFYVAWAKTSPDADRIAKAAAGLRDMKYPVTVRDLGERPRDLRPEELAELVRWIDTLDRI